MRRSTYLIFITLFIIVGWQLWNRDQARQDPLAPPAEPSVRAAPVTSLDFHSMNPGQTFRECEDCPEMVVIPSGSFAMGSSEEETERDVEAEQGDPHVFARFFMKREHPQHAVTIGRSFGLGRYLVTRGEFAAFIKQTGYLPARGCFQTESKGSGRGAYQAYLLGGWQTPGFNQTDQDPVVCVSWRGAQAYVAWLNGRLRAKGGVGGDGPYRLPTEAEWEYAARAGTKAARWWGDTVGIGNAKCDGCGSMWTNTAPVGSFRPNPFGLYDMLGNAWEWTEDCWNARYGGAPEDGSAWTTGDCDKRVARGGGWSAHPWIVRSAHRTSFEAASSRDNNLGFRVARTLQ